MKENKKFERFLQKSPINYFSDLFIAAMVIMWIAVIFIMAVMAIYSTLVWADNSIWSDLGALVQIPLASGGAIWMIKNAVQHKIAAQQGKKVEEDFPEVNDSIDITGMEKPLKASQYEDVFKDEK